MTGVLQSKLPADMNEARKRKLPGIQALGHPDWIVVDEAYADQLQEKSVILTENTEKALQVLETADEATHELLEETLILLKGRIDFEVTGSRVRRPDHQIVTVDFARPLQTLASLVQEDLCILQKFGDEHVLTAGLLCFPSSWSLQEKLGRGLVSIHVPVPEYDDNIARRVQRLFDGVRVGQPIWRANDLRYADPELFQSRRENERRSKDIDEMKFIRSERQTIFRLPVTKAVVFALHTYVVPL